MSEPPVEVVMDESGNSGEDLLNEQQPVYSLAAVAIDVESAREAVDEALSRTQMPELKFGKLRSSAAGQRNVVGLLESLKLTEGSAAVWAAHKPTMLALKLVDELVAPRLLRSGLQVPWYESGDARRMAFLVAQRAPVALGETYSTLMTSFVALVRRYDSATAQGFIAALQAARTACTDPDVGAVLSLMIDTQPDLRGAFSGYRDNLEPAAAALFWQGGYWSERLRRPFAVIHDESNTVERWEQTFADMRDHAHNIGQQVKGRQPRTLTIGDQTGALPDQMAELRFAHSDEEPRLQVADILAGASAHLVETLAGARAPNRFARELVRVGLPELLADGVVPDPDTQALAYLRLKTSR